MAEEVVVDLVVVVMVLVLEVVVVVRLDDVVVDVLEVELGGRLRSERAFYLGRIPDPE